MYSEKLKAGYWLNKLWIILLNLKDNFFPLVNNSLVLQTITAIAFFSIILYFIRKIILLRKSLKEESILLELTPPAVTEQSSYTTERLFSLINSIGNQRTWGDRLLGYKTRFSLEIASTENQGIRYLLRTTPKEVNTLRRSLLSYLPQLAIKTVNEYLPENEEMLKSYHYRVLEFGLSHHFAFPLKRQDELEEHDPIAYITGMMTKLSLGELISLQVLVSPVRPRQTKKISKAILYNLDIVKYLNSRRIIPIIPAKPAYANTSFEQEIVKSINTKINQQLFDTRIRLLIIVKDKEELSERIKGFTSSLTSFSGSGYQSIVKAKSMNTSLVKKYLFFAFRKRWTGLSKSSILSTSEISDIYHFPYTSTTKTEDLVKIHSKELPAPLSLKRENKDVMFAKNTYGGKTINIGLTKEEREKHVYIIGATGAGKTTMVLSMANQDIKNGKGIGVIDPHGDLAESLISCIPEERKDDFIYVNPDDIKYPIGINLLELTPGLDEDELLREKELITESVVSLFRKVFSEVWSAHAHRLEYILRNTIQTALTLEDPTIFTVYELLVNPDFQKHITKNLQDENLKNFWKYEFNKAGDYQKVKMIGPVTSRIGRFLFSPSAKRILEQKKSTINFEEIMDKKKILICNLSKGKLGEDNSEVLGIMILTKIQLTALKRARVSQAKREPFYLYVDEFQTFATPSFIQMLSEARKFKVFLTMAEQSTSQQKDRNLVNVILANVGTVISFRSANPDDEKIMLPQFMPYIQSGEIANLPSFKFYMKISAINPEEPFSGETVPVEIKVDEKRMEELIQLSRDRNAILYQKSVIPKSPIVSRNDFNSQGNIEVQDVGIL